MAVNLFQKATKGDGWLKMCISGPSGSGKTMTALKMGQHLASDPRSGNKRMAFLDTETGSASLYADKFDFDVLEVSEPYTMASLMDIITNAAQAGYGCLVIDSATHFYVGKGGLLEQVAGIAKAKYNNNTYAAWNDGAHIQQDFVYKMKAAKMHVIVTVRSKTKYVEVEGARKGTMKKVGMDVEQRPGFEYEFDVFASMDIDHEMYFEKSRCSEIDKKFIQDPGTKEAKILYDWLKGARTVDGIAVADSDYRLSDTAIKMMRALRSKGTTFTQDATDDAVEAIGIQLGIDAIGATKVAERIFDSGMWSTEAVAALKSYMEDPKKVEIIREYVV